LRVRLKEQVVHRELARGARTALDLLWMNGLTVSKTVHNSGIETDQYAIEKERDIAVVRVYFRPQIMFMMIASNKLDNIHSI